jgi:DNA-binding NtrC family response regulator
MEWFFSTERGLFFTLVRHSLPRTERQVPLMIQPLGPQHNQKTILVVDDEPDILDFVSKLLVDGNYHVLTGSSGEDGLQQSRDYNGEIHLLLTDFQMPGITGIELATQMSLQRPQLKVLMMSGFTGGMLVLNEGWHFLPKPFIVSQLRALILGLVSPNGHSKFSR